MTYYNLHTHDLSLSTDRKLSICNLPYKNSFTSPDAYPGVYFSAGIHPWHIASTDPTSLTSQLSRIAESPQLLAIGECGLDKLTDPPIDIQITIFKQQIEIAENSKKPMIIHCVKAFNELIKLRKETAARQEWIIHGFRGKPQLATELIQHGFRISIGHKFNPETARIIPLHRLFLETDDSNIDIETVYRQIAEYGRFRKTSSSYRSVQTFPNFSIYPDKKKYIIKLLVLPYTPFFVFNMYLCPEATIIKLQ